MPIHTDFIIDFLRRHENRPPHFKPILKGYVPSNNGVPIAQSGVTIATGCDLGQQTPDGLSKMGVPPTLLSRLAPYCGLRRQDAMIKLSSFPLIISETEADAIDTAVINSYIREVQNRFDQDVARADAFLIWRFADQPREVQAVLVSLRYQLGFGGFPKTWAMIVAGNYPGAIAELRDPARWGGKYMSRRRDEADLLKKAAQ